MAVPGYGGVTPRAAGGFMRWSCMRSVRGAHHVSAVPAHGGGHMTGRGARRSHDAPPAPPDVPGQPGPWRPWPRCSSAPSWRCSSPPRRLPRPSPTSTRSCAGGLSLGCDGAAGEGLCGGHGEGGVSWCPWRSCPPRQRSTGTRQRGPGRPGIGRPFREGSGRGCPGEATAVSPGVRPRLVHGGGAAGLGARRGG